MSIPRQVLRDAAAADATLEQLRNSATPPADAPPPDPPQPPAPPALPPPPVAEDWKARHDVAAHRVSVLEGITRTQGDEIRGLNAQLKQLKADMEAAKAAPPKPAPDLTKYDPELLEAVDHTVEQRIAPTRQELEKLRADREARDAVEAKAREDDAKKREFADFLDEFVPTWRNDDNDPAFATWLLSLNSATGQQWQASYVDAIERRDYRAMARVFKAFLAQAKPLPTPPPAPPVVPPVAGRTDPGAAPQGRIFTSAEVAAYYDDVLKGRLKARGWTQKRIDEEEREIMAAYAEGRVRG